MTDDPTLPKIIKVGSEFLLHPESWAEVRSFVSGGGGGLHQAPVRAIPDHPRFCQSCGVVIRVQIFRGTGYCCNLCLKEGEARDRVGGNAAPDG